MDTTGREKWDIKQALLNQLCQQLHFSFGRMHYSDCSALCSIKRFLLSPSYDPRATLLSQWQQPAASLTLQSGEKGE